MYYSSLFVVQCNQHHFVPSLFFKLVDFFSFSKNDRRMKIRKCLHKVIVPPNTVKQGFGVVLVDKTLMTTNFNLLCPNRIQAIRDLEVRATVFFTSKIHALNTLSGLVLWPYIYGHFLGSIFYGGISPSKNGLSAPSLERTQLRSTARVFLYT
jgi:hypothetical protein